jgi:hypothetical protein
MALVEIVTVGRWIAAGLLGFLSLLIIIANPLTAVHVTKQGRSYSWVPFIGGFAGLLAVLVLPAGSWRDRVWFAWIPIALDLTYAMFLFVAIWYWLLGHEPSDPSTDHQAPPDPTKPAN